MSDRSDQMVFIGYEKGSKAYRMYDPRSRKLVVSRDVVFEEDRPWDWSSPGSELIEDQEPLVVTYSQEDIQGDAAAGAVDDMGSRAHFPAAAGKSPEKSAEAARSPKTPVAAGKSVETSGVAAPERGIRTRTSADLAPIPLPADLGGLSASPPSAATVSSTPYSEPSQGPQGKRLLEELYDETKEVKEALSGLCLYGLEEPPNHLEALKENCWKQAMREELTSIEENRTWEVCDLPTGHRPIGLKWVYKIKKNPAGEVVKHKARLVAKGYVQ
jgi:hypothetical protein